MTPPRFVVAVLLTLCSLCWSRPARATGLSPELAGAFVLGADGGAQLSTAMLFRPMPERGLLLGPRASWTFGENGRGGELALGGQGTLWFLNAIGPGAAIEAVRSADDWNLRVQPTVTFRLLRSGDGGAWAFRVGASYDSRFRWGALLGISFQISGT